MFLPGLEIDRNMEQYMNNYNKTAFQKLSYYHSFNIAEDKNQNTLNYFTDEKVFYPSTETYKRNTKCHKKGDFKSYYKWQPKYNSIIDAWKDCRTYKQVSTGLNHQIRNCIYVDIDNDIIDTYRYKKCSIEPTFVIRNPKTGHGAFIFVLNENSSYNFIKPYWKTLTNELGGDLNYKCWQCKNPFNKNIEIVSSNENLTYSLNYIENNVIPTYDTTTKSNNSAITKSNIISNIYYSRSVTNNNNSRNDIFLSEYRNLIWNFMRKHDGIAPVESDRNNLANTADDMAGKCTGKQAKRFTDADEYKRSEDAIYEWTVEHYKANGGFSTIWDDKAREVAVWVKACTKLLDFKKIFEIKGTAKDIAKITGFSIRKVYRLINIDNEEKDRLFGCALKLKNYVENCSSEVTDKVLNVYNEVFKEGEI